VAVVFQAQFAHLKLAHGHTRKIFRIGVAFALYDVFEYSRAVHVEVSTKQHAYQRQLAYTIGYVQDFDEKIQNHQVVAKKLAQHEATQCDGSSKYIHVSIGMLTTRIVHILINCANHILHHLAIFVQFIYTLEVM